MNRRAFIKGLIALATAPAIGKYVNVFKPAPVREGIEQVASRGVDFFNSVIKKVMEEGTLVNESDRIQTFKHPDRPDINVEVDMGSGSSSVYFDTDQGTKAGAELSTDIEVSPAYTELRENEEVYKTGAGGEVYKDVDERITGGITNLEEFLKRKKGFAAGGRVGFDIGGAVLDKVASFFFDEEGSPSQALQRAKFEISKFLGGMGTDLETGAEWYNKLEPEEQKAIIEEKIKYRQRTDDVPVYDERYAGTRGIGGNYAEGGRVGMWRGGVPKGLAAALRAIRSKFGDDSITTADKAPQPEKTIQELIMDFNARTKSSYKPGDAITSENFKSTGFAPDLSGLEKAKKLGLSEYPIWENPEKVRAAVDDIFPSGDYKYDAQMASEALVENNPDAFANKLFDDLDQNTQLKIYGAVVEVVQNDLAKMLQMKRLSKPTQTLEGIEKTGTINISDPNVAEEFTRFMKENDPKGFKDVEEKVELMNFDPKGRKKNAKGGHIKDDADVSLTVIEIPDISQSGVESLFKRR